MIRDFISFHEQLINNNIEIKHRKLCKFVQDYSFYYFESQINDKNQTIFQKIKESKIITIDYFNELNENQQNFCFIIGFKKTLILIHYQKLKPFIEFIFKINSNLEIHFLKDTKNIFDQYINIQYKESINNIFFEEENSNFKQYFRLTGSKAGLFRKIWKIILSSITSYVIKASYMNLNKNRINDYYLNDKEIETSDIIEENDYVDLRCIEVGSSCVVKLIYHIEKEEFFVLKKSNIFANDEMPKLLKRETNNYAQIKHPFLPKFVGTTKNNDLLVIEFIYGQTLQKIQNLKLNEKEKITIILQILSVIDYLHQNGFIYRDLKPNNIIIDQNKTAVLIDFDRMIKYDKNEEQTKDLNSYYVAPEISYGKPCKESDVYSIGQIIYFIMTEKDPINDISSNVKELKDDKIIQKIYSKCTKENPDERPFISKLIECFLIICQDKNYILENIEPYYLNKLGLMVFKKDIQKGILYFQQSAKLNNIFACAILGQIYFSNEYVPIDIYKAIPYLAFAANHNNPRAQYYLGRYYFENQYIQRDTNKAIYYFTLSANQNDQLSQIYLGILYLKGEYIEQNLNKSIYYLTLAGNNNNKYSQNILGVLYLKRVHTEKNIEKAIYYLTLAANNNDSYSQYDLGLIYFNNRNNPQNINKAIYYFALASKQNHKLAQLYLGLIYYDGECHKKDINKAIYYFTLSANQNEMHSQFFLGLIYFEGKYIQKDIKKAIYYFTLSANQNYSEAQYNLGLIYYDNQNIQRDINKSIYYFTLAANNNYISAQLNLGIIYNEGIFIARDINKSIYYLTMASNLEDPEAQLYLGLIYFNGLYIKKDINKALNLYLRAANNNSPDAQFILGIIYFDDTIVPRDINKSIYYLSLSAKQKNIFAHYYLGLIYYEGKYVKQNIQKAIQNLTFAAHQNLPEAQFYLGLIYYEGKYVSRDIELSLKYLNSSSKNKFHEAQLLLGDIYLEGEYVKRDISKSIKYYKELSSFNDEHAKNNLAIIYKNGFNEIKPNINYAKEYLIEAISQKNDCVSMYNLSNILWDEGDKENFKSIQLLIDSSIRNFGPSTLLFGLILFDKYGYVDLEIIEKVLKKYNIEQKEEEKKIYYAFKDLELFVSQSKDFKSIKSVYTFLHNNDLIYINDKIVVLFALNKEENYQDFIKLHNIMKINNDFYDGFGIY